MISCNFSKECRIRCRVCRTRLRHFLLLVRINWSQTGIVRNFARSIYTRDPTCIRTQTRSCNFQPRQEIKIGYCFSLPFVRADIFVVISPEKNRKNKDGKKACEKDRNQERNEEDFVADGKSRGESWNTRQERGKLSNFRIREFFPGSPEYP